MQPSLNKVTIIGTLGKDPELIYTTTGSTMAKLLVATNNNRISSDGKRSSVTEWHTVLIWGKTAENCAKYLIKGQSVYVEGRLQTSSWVDKTTQVKHYKTEIAAKEVIFLSYNNKSQLNEKVGESDSEYYSSAMQQDDER